MSDHPDKAQCQSCCFWQPLEKVPGKGECRRYPPQVFANVSTESDGLYSKDLVTHDDCCWPWTGAADWCGEFKKGDA